MRTDLPLISVVIPTRDRVQKLAACLAGLRDQTLDLDRFEVLISTDGRDLGTIDLIRRWQGVLPVMGLENPRLGPSHARNAAIRVARAPLLLFLNDDVRPEPGLLEAHVEAHARPRPAGPVSVVGASLFAAPPAGGSLFDRLIRETSMVFFYHRMMDSRGRATQPADYDWGFRHAWTLNLSLPRSAALAVGGFRPALANCCYEDLEFAWRLKRELGMPVWFEPQARAPHDHAFTPRSYLEREQRLGYSALGFARTAPECAGEVFGVDIAGADEAEYAKRFVEREGRHEGSWSATFESLASIPAESIDGPGCALVLAGLANSHLMLKKLAFRRGLLEALNGVRLEGLFHSADGLEVDPPLRSARAA